MFKYSLHAKNKLLLQLGFQTECERQINYCGRLQHKEFE